MNIKHSIRLTYLIIRTRIQNILLKHPYVENDITTLDKILKERSSISRFGDGEIALMNGQDLKFQKSDPVLQKRLKEVISSSEDGLLVCIPNIFRVNSLQYLTYDSKIFWLKELLQNKDIWYQVPKDRTYYDACISRPYIRNENKKHAEQLFIKLKKIWENRNIVIIEGEHSRLGVGNDLFANASSISRILCPKKNAFSCYQDILDYANTLDKESLILISLGPTATILAYDLHRSGYQAIDLGHIDLEYEWYLQGAKERVLIKNKEVNELSDTNTFAIKDQVYESQILTKIHCGDEAYEI